MRIFISFLLLSFFSGLSFAESLSIEGTYQGRNLYVQNPMDDEGFGYCATKVTVNGDIMPGGTGMGAFEIDFSIFNIEIGEPIFIVIEHNDGCKPKILNPEVLLPRSTFVISDMSISDDGKLIWKTKSEQGKLPFSIEQYRWNKWVVIGEVAGKGGGKENAYEFGINTNIISKILSVRDETQYIRLVQNDDDHDKLSIGFINENEQTKSKKQENDVDTQPKKSNCYEKFFHLPVF